MQALVVVFVFNKLVTELKTVNIELGILRLGAIVTEYSHILLEIQLFTIYHLFINSFVLNDKQDSL